MLNTIVGKRLIQIEDQLKVKQSQVAGLTEAIENLKTERLLLKTGCKAGDTIIYEGEKGIVCLEQSGDFLKFYPIKADGEISKKHRYARDLNKLVKRD